MLYLRGNGYARGGAVKLGPDIVEFLEGNGHTFVGNARSQIEKMSQSSWNKIQESWTRGDTSIELFFGLNPHKIEDLYLRKLSVINSKSSGIIPGKDTKGMPGVGGAKGGSGLIKPSYAFNGFNGTGWDTINLLQIAEDGTLDEDYTIKMKNLQTNPITDEFDQVRTNLAKGSALGTYGTTPPSVSKSAPATTTGTTPVVEDEEEEEEEEEEVVVAPVVTYEFDDDLIPADITEIIGQYPKGKLFPAVPFVESGERKVSSKAYDGLDTTKTIVVTSGLIEVNMKTLPKTQGVSLFDAVAGGLEFDDYETVTALGIASGKVIEVEYEDPIEGETQEQLLVAPNVKFIVNVDEGKVYIVINGLLLGASSGHDEYTFTECAIKIHDPSSKDEGIAEVLLDGTPMEFGKWIPKDGYHNAHYDYGFPFNGIEGLPPPCYEEYYPADDDDDVEKSAVTFVCRSQR